MSLGNEGGIDHFSVELEGPRVVLRFRDDSASPIDLFGIGPVGAPNHVDLFGVHAGAGGKTGPSGVEGLATAPRARQAPTELQQPAGTGRALGADMG